MADSDLPSYQISLSAQVGGEIKQLANIAEQAGKKASFLSSLATISQRLRHDPAQFGEYRFGFPTLWFSHPEAGLLYRRTTARGGAVCCP